MMDVPFKRKMIESTLPLHRISDFLPSLGGMNKISSLGGRKRNHPL
jgi:hypothetical protein